MHRNIRCALLYLCMGARKWGKSRHAVAPIMNKKKFVRYMGGGGRVFLLPFLHVGAFFGLAPAPHPTKISADAHVPMLNKMLSLLLSFNRR